MQKYVLAEIFKKIHRFEVPKGSWGTKVSGGILTHRHPDLTIKVRNCRLPDGVYRGDEIYRYFEYGIGATGAAPRSGNWPEAPRGPLPKGDVLMDLAKLKPLAAFMKNQGEIEHCVGIRVERHGTSVVDFTKGMTLPMDMGVDKAVTLPMWVLIMMDLGEMSFRLRREGSAFELEQGDVLISGELVWEPFPRWWCCIPEIMPDPRWVGRFAVEGMMDIVSKALKAKATKLLVRTTDRGFYLKFQQRDGQDVTYWMMAPLRKGIETFAVAPESLLATIRQFRCKGMFVSHEDNRLVIRSEKTIAKTAVQTHPPERGEEISDRDIEKAEALWSRDSAPSSTKTMEVV